MRSEKGITLVALIGIFVVLIILTGISISVAIKGNNEEPVVEDTPTTVETPVENEELVVNPNVENDSTDEDSTVVTDDAEVVDEDVVEDDTEVVDGEEN